MPRRCGSAPVRLRPGRSLFLRAYFAAGDDYVLERPGSGRLLKAGGMPMARAVKEATVAELTERFQNSSGAVLTEYRGLTVAQVKELRRALGEDATFSVVKNTLTKIAAKDAGMAAEFADLLTGP